MDIDSAKSYATKENLMKALEKLGFAKDRHVVVRNSEGRWTAIFPASNRAGTGDMMVYVWKGFMIIG